MNHMDITLKRIVLYVIGLFVLALGVGFSIQAALGVSPVSSLAYAFALTTGLSVGMMTVVANIVFIILQAILKKRIDYKEYGIQLIVTFLFGFYMDLSLYLVQLLPTPETLWARWTFLIISLFVVSFGLFGYFNAKLPLMPYDALTFAISERFQLPFPKAKITSDLVNVCVAGLMCLIFIHAFGSIGIGTLVAAYFIGKILGFFMARFQDPLIHWINKSKQEESTDLL